MSDLYLLHYNNLYNKLIKVEQNLIDYQPYQLGLPLLNTNFNPNDGVTTEHIINWEYAVPDYILVVESGAIISRWFVEEAARTRGKQLRLRLRRDVIADNYNAVKQSTCFVQKGFLQNSNPLIFNNENMGFNQIKRSETLLENNLKTPWIILYLSRYHNANSEAAPENTTWEYNEFKGTFSDQPSTRTADYELDALSDYKYYYYSQEGNDLIYTPQDALGFYAAINRGDGTRWIGLTKSGQVNPASPTPAAGNWPEWPNENSLPTIPNQQEYWDNLAYEYTQGFGSGPVSGISINSYTGSTSQTGYNNLNRENGKTIKVGNQFYRIKAVWTKQAQVRSAVPSSSVLGTEMIASFYTNTGISTEGKDLSGIYIQDYQMGSSADGSYVLSLKFEAEGVEDSENFQYDFTYDRAITKDSVYEIVAIPYKDVTFTDGATTFSHRGDVGMLWAQDLINKYNGAGWAYDIQLVPYCPIDDTNITNYNKVYCYKTEEGQQVNYAVGFQISQASFSLYYNLTLEYNSNNKISNETELFRFVSPNGIGEYEFSPAKNGGLEGFEVDCTLIPFNPYIKVNPLFGGLYGGDFNDYRGLICGGDYSLPILNNAWETYQLNNKYYQDIFQRKIETQEYNNKWQLASGIAGALAGAGAGAAAGTLIAPGIGTVIGGALSAAGGALDVIAQQSMFREGIQAQKDLFGFELGTIKARAETLTRTTSYNINNKYFPYVEYYSCTDEEITALENKIKYNGVTVGVVGTLNDYIDSTATSYVQAQLIEIDITDDAHMATEIARVLQEGIRFYVN